MDSDRHLCLTRPALPDLRIYLSCRASRGGEFWKLIKRPVKQTLPQDLPEVGAVEKASSQHSNSATWLDPDGTASDSLAGWLAACSEGVLQGPTTLCHHKSFSCNAPHLHQERSVGCRCYRDAGSGFPPFMDPIQQKLQGIFWRLSVTTSAQHMGVASSQTPATRPQTATNSGNGTEALPPFSFHLARHSAIPVCAETMIVMLMG